jgi:hypothetical protein
MLAYFGGCNSGDRSQSLMWAAVSAFRAPQKQFSGHAHQEEKRIPRAIEANESQPRREP